MVKSLLNKKGLTLVEVAVSATILTIILSTSLTLIARNLILATRTANLTTATGFAQEKLAAATEGKGTPCSGYSPTNTTDTRTINGIQYTAVTEDINGFSEITSSIISTDKISPSDFNRIKVTVTWKDSFSKFADTSIEVSQYVRIN